MPVSLQTDFMAPESSHLRFTILEHDHPFLHWDLLMQQGKSLATWRLLQKPGKGYWIPSEKLPDHRLIYLDYEGPVSGGRGHATQFCTGNFAFSSVEVVEGEVAVDKAFRLSDCELGTKAFCRFYNTDKPEWRFE